MWCTVCFWNLVKIKCLYEVYTWQLNRISIVCLSMSIGKCDLLHHIIIVSICNHCLSDPQPDENQNQYQSQTQEKHGQSLEMWKPSLPTCTLENKITLRYTMTTCILPFPHVVHTVYSELCMFKVDLHTLWFLL